MCVPAQLCLTFCESMDCSPPGSSVMGFSRQEYWSGLPFPPPGDLPDLTKIKPASPVSSALASEFFITEPSRKPSNYFICINNCYPRWHTIFVF